MKIQSTSQASLHFLTFKVALVVQLFIALPLVFFTLQRYLVLPVIKAILDLPFFASASLCLPSIYLYNQKQTKLCGFVIL